jgi:predicted DCC family thiol-disulfide oxidoreductase YuxK
MPAPPAFPLKVFYDGSCIVCATAVERYGRRDRAGRLVLVDASLPDFDPAPYGISRAEFMYEMHVIDRNGRVYRGPEAFWAIWQAFPASTFYGFLGLLVTLPGMSTLARLVYRGFARIRRFLPKRKDACPDGSCRIGKEKPAP